LPPVAACPAGRVAIGGGTFNVSLDTTVNINSSDYSSSTIVTGPSLTSSTDMRAPKTPVCTETSSPRSSSQNAS
jgi:hypothetical protein